MRKLVFMILALPIFLMSCQPQEKSVEAMTLEQEKNAAIISPYNDDDEIDTINVGKFAFEEKVIDFGTIKEGEKINFTFKFKNVGKAPLMIARANTTCGCTVPNPPREPIPVGDTNVIKGTFNSAGKSGQQLKKITLIANTFPRETQITIKGFVEKEADK